MDRSAPLTLRPLTDSGDRPVEALELPSEGRVVIGRGADADWVVPAPAVSRRHARVDAAGGECWLSDLGSRHGTRLNGQPLVPGERVPVRPGDRITLGDWSCRAEGRARGSTVSSVVDDGRTSRISTLNPATLVSVPRVRIETILEAVGRLAGAQDRATLERVLIESASGGTGCSRVLLVRPAADDDFEILASTPGAAATGVSRSALRGAWSGDVVELRETGHPSGRLGGGGPSASPGADAAFPHSAAEMGLRGAICAPVFSGDAVDCLLYLDARGGERALPEDAGAFCVALAEVAGMALNRLEAAEIDARRAALERDLEAARHSQQLLLPAASGQANGLRYTLDSRPGRCVAGDLFDVLDLPDGRTAFFLGDVSGKGLGAGVVMAAAQAELRTMFLHGLSIGRTLSRLNDRLLERGDPGRFITLIGCVWDARAGELELADAGHGLCVVRRPGGAAEPLFVEGGPPLGVAPGIAYAPVRLACPPGTRVVLFSDGVSEQPDREGEPFGVERVAGLIGGAETHEQDGPVVMRALESHAAGAFTDDVTIASIELSRAETAASSPRA